MSHECPLRIRNGLDGPPRIEPLSESEFDDRMRDAMDRADDLMEIPRGGPVHPFMGTFVRHVELFARYMEIGMNFLNNSEIPDRERELVILRTGWLCDAPFEWGEHVAAGKEHGLSREEISRVEQGSGAQGWSELDRALLRATEELHSDATISDETWSVLADHLDEKQLIELPVLVGQYHTTAFVQNALRFVPGRNRYGEEVEEESVA